MLLNDEAQDKLTGSKDKASRRITYLFESMKVVNYMLENVLH